VISCNSRDRQGTGDGSPRRGAAIGLRALRESTIRIALLVARTMDPITAPLRTARIYTEMSVEYEDTYKLRCLLSRRI
jgi:hypothetical protein